MLQDRGALLTGVGVGAGLMYFLDPERGRRRRALVRDQMAHVARTTRDAAGATSRDVAHRTSGTVARVRGTFSQGPIDDHVLVERVRTRLGRVISHPHAIDVLAADGVVTMRGPILQHEVKRLLKAVKSVAGVREVINELQEHKEPGNIPSLQGGSTPPKWRPDILQRSWSPATRVMAGGGGMALAGYGLARRTLPGALLAAAGVALVARAATNLESSRLTGIGGKRRAVDVQKTITIDAPVEQVFGFWTAYENFPRFMSRVLEVRPNSRERRSHWTVVGPAGVPVEFDAEVSALVPNEALAWHTIEGAPVAHAGIVRFEPTEDGQTRVHIRMSYNPPGGWLGHGVAAAFGADPKRSLDADLVRMKTLIETGRPPRDAAQPVAPGDRSLPM
jgi:uncharacterized membrane protein/osmotically-inducible protein OsmY